MKFGVYNIPNEERKKELLSSAVGLFDLSRKVQALIIQQDNTAYLVKCRPGYENEVFNRTFEEFSIKKHKEYVKQYGWPEFAVAEEELPAVENRFIYVVL